MPSSPRGAKRLIVNADDLGYTRDVNEGILRCHVDGIVRSASLMPNGGAFEHAVGAARRHPDLAVGCHLTLVEGESVARPGERLPSSVAQLLAAPPDRSAVVREFRAQIEKMLRHGLRPTHLDTHKHVHLLPPVFDAVAQLADDFGIRWVRKPFDLPVSPGRGHRALAAAVIRPFQIHFRERLRRARCRTTDYFAGMASTGTLNAAWLVSLIGALPCGIGEVVCHPGRCGPELSAMPTRLKQSREAEMEALCDASVRRAVSAHGIELVSHRNA